MFSTLSKLLCAPMLLGIITSAYALPYVDSQATEMDLISQHISHDTSGVVMIAEGEDNQRQAQVPSGSLLLPESGGASNEKEKKCMTVCGRWGEDCTYINRGCWWHHQELSANLSAVYPGMFLKSFSHEV